MLNSPPREMTPRGTHLPELSPHMNTEWHKNLIKKVPKLQDFMFEDVEGEDIFSKIAVKQQTMNPKIMEIWLNDTLADAENIGISGCLLKTDKKPPLERYKLD